MTEHRGAYARWSAAALLAPTAAAVFFGASTWAQGHRPQTVAAVPSAPVISALPAPDARLTRLQASTAAERAALTRLEVAVQRMRGQAARGFVGPARPTSSGVAGSAPRTTQGPAGRTPTRTPARTASAPPPVHAVTGASGAVK